MVVMIVVTVLMAAVLVMHMSLLGRLLPVRVGVVGILLLGAVVDAGDLREVAKAFSCGPSAACSVKVGESADSEVHTTSQNRFRPGDCLRRRALVAFLFA
jgi:hypothetical protein